MMKNVQGSSAGAGSGEFHVYKQNRRREYERLKIMDEKAQRVSPSQFRCSGRSVRWGVQPRRAAREGGTSRGQQLLPPRLEPARLTSTIVQPYVHRVPTTQMISWTDSTPSLAFPTPLSGRGASRLPRPSSSQRVRRRPEDKQEPAQATEEEGTRAGNHSLRLSRWRSSRRRCSRRRERCRTGRQEEEA